METTNSNKSLSKPQINSVSVPLGLSTLLHFNHQVVPDAVEREDDNSIRSARNSSYLNSKSVPNISNNGTASAELPVTNAS